MGMLMLMLTRNNSSPGIDMFIRHLRIHLIYLDGNDCCIAVLLYSERNITLIY